jgi:ABC-2 type transport system permease protein
MLRRIARKELLELVRDGRFRWSAALVAVLLVAALAMGASQVRTISREHATAQRATRADWLAQGAKNPHSAAHYGIYAFKPKTALALVDRGVDPFTGVLAWLEAHRQNEFKYRPAQDQTALQRFGELTAATVLQLLLPLLVIILAFPTFAGEREQGTMRHVLSLGVSRRVIAAGKALGLAAGLALLLMPAALIGAIALLMTAGGPAVRDSLPRLGVMTLGYVVYFAIFVALALGVSARARSSRAALVVLVAFWMVNGLVGPRAVTDLSKSLCPTPSSVEFAQLIERDLRVGIDGHDPEDARAKALEARLLRQYGVEKIEQLPINFAGVAMQEGEEYGNRVFDKHYGALWDVFRRQRAVHQLGALVSPLLGVRSISMAAAGTDVAHHVRFQAAAEQYRRHLVKRMNDHFRDHAGKEEFAYLADDNLWKAVPAFAYDTPPLGVALATEPLSMALLGIWCLAATAFAACSVLRVEA